MEEGTGRKHRIQPLFIKRRTVILKKKILSSCLEQWRPMPSCKSWLYFIWADAIERLLRSWNSHVVSVGMFSVRGGADSCQPLRASEKHFGFLFPSNTQLRCQCHQHCHSGVHFEGLTLASLQPTQLDNTRTSSAAVGNDSENKMGPWGQVKDFSHRRDKMAFARSPEC